MTPKLAGQALGLAGRYLDRRMGLETAALVDEATLGYDPDQLRGYEPSRWFILRAALARHEVTDRDVFLDLGSGKGRVVLEAAARYPFRRVLGVELSPDLTAVARANAARVRRPLRCADVEFVTADATQWQPPDDLSIVYLFNPFRGETFAAVLRRLRRLVDERGWPLRVIYANPTQHEQLIRWAGVREVPLSSALAPRMLGIPAGWIRRYELHPTS